MYYPASNYYSSRDDDVEADRLCEDYGDDFGVNSEYSQWKDDTTYMPKLNFYEHSDPDEERFELWFECTINMNQDGVFGYMA